ncbi:MAG: ATP-binding cassette domain-containing protein, partial [ANME-2 cluster archaeon]
MIELANISFSYPERPVLRDVNLCIRSGEYLGVTGDNGSGKTTLVKLLNGLLLPQEGQVTVGGASTSDRESLLAIRRSVGIVFQNPDAQAVGETVEEDIVFGLENIRVPGREIDRRIERYLGMLGIKELRDRNIGLLSGGQKQLVNIAAVMAMEPACIVFDEALSMLDAGNRRNVLQMISRLNRRGTSIIQITHNPADLGNCHRVIAISEGRISQQGLVEDAEEANETNETNKGKEGGGEVRDRRTGPGSGVFREGCGIEIRHLSHTYSPGTEWAVPALR